MMAKKCGDEIRLYSLNDIDGDMGMLSSKYRVLKKNSKRVVKTQKIPFDWKDEIAKIYVSTENQKKCFVIKSKYCLGCT